MCPGKMYVAFRDPRTPIVARVLAVAAIAYAVLPLDIAWDIIPIVGQIDDVMILLTPFSFSMNMIPEEVFKSVGLDVPLRREV